MPKVVATVEARMNSSRVPGKVLMQVCGKPILWHIWDRIKAAKSVDEVVIATTENEKDNEIEKFCRENRIKYFRGSENNVLNRIVKTAEYFEADHIVQMTGDCPLVDPAIIDKCLGLYFQGHFDYFSNRLRPTYPCGTEVQVFPLSVLKRVEMLTQDPVDQEHGSYYIYNHPEIFRLGTFQAPDIFCPEKRWVLDYPEDFEFVRKVYEALYFKNHRFDTYDVLKFLEMNPEIENLNKARGVIVKNYL